MPASQFSFIFDRDMFGKHLLSAPYHYWIINLDKRPAKQNTGTHWTVLWWDKHAGSFFYVDSYGFPPDNRTIAFIGSHKLVDLTRQIQSWNTSTCGWWCLNAIALASGGGFEKYWQWVMKYISYDFDKNENKMKLWVKSLLTR